MRVSNDVGVQAGDELDSGDHLANEIVIVGQKEIGAGLRGAGEMDGVGGGDSLPGTDIRIQVCRLQGIRNYFDRIPPKKISDTSSCFHSASFMETDERLSNRIGARAQLILAGAHTLENLLDAVAVPWMVFEPIDEQHRVPVDAAHDWRSKGSLPGP